MNHPAEVFPPGDFIREELEARGWTQSDMAEIMGRPVETIHRIVTGKLAVTPETACGLAAAFGTSAELWVNLESAYQLSRTHQDDGDVARRSRLYSIAPIKEMARRKWIEASSNIDVMERQVIKFFELATIDDQPRIRVAARKSTDYTETTPVQLAWYFRAKHLAATLDTKPYRKKLVESELDSLRVLGAHPQEVRHVPRLLADWGIRFVVVQHLPRSKIDGATFWMNKGEPVIAMSLRYDRIDWFWHTLGHELGHVLHGDVVSIDSEIVGKTHKENASKPAVERQADEFAANLLIPREELEDFILRVRPLYSRKKIQGFAARLGVHPGIVVGQLQYNDEISYSRSREMLVKVRDLVMSSALTDGWGNTVTRSSCLRRSGSAG